MKAKTRKLSQSTIQRIRIFLDTFAKNQGAAVTPKGIFRFKTCEDAQSWMIKQTAALEEEKKQKGK
jgi:hypothetical protein